MSGKEKCNIFSHFGYNETTFLYTEKCAKNYFCYISIKSLGILYIFIKCYCKLYFDYYLVFLWLSTYLRYIRYSILHLIYFATKFPPSEHNIEYNSTSSVSFQISVLSSNFFPNLFRSIFRFSRHYNVCKILWTHSRFCRIISFFGIRWHF